MLLYRLSLFGPPQDSELLPAQAMLQSPAGVGAPPLAREEPQSTWDKMSWVHTYHVKIWTLTTFSGVFHAGQGVAGIGASGGAFLNSESTSHAHANYESTINVVVTETEQRVSIRMEMSRWAMMTYSIQGKSNYQLAEQRREVVVEFVHSRKDSTGNQRHTPPRCSQCRAYCNRRDWQQFLHE